MTLLLLLACCLEVDLDTCKHCGATKFR